MNLCPICHKPNNCAIVSGTPANKCWCTRVEIPLELLDDYHGQPCICENCVKEYWKKVDQIDNVVV